MNALLKTKHFIQLIFSLLIAVMPLSACTPSPAVKNERLSVVCTVFPPYDWVRQILGGKADTMDLTLLLNSRMDLHNYQPSVDDIVRISACDLFIHIGGESDSWVEAVLKGAANPNRVTVNLLETLGSAAKPEAIIEGMEEYDDDQAEYDEHIWLSLKNARLLCMVIAEALSAIDADNAPYYQENMNEYLEKLTILDAEYQAAVNAAPVKTLLFGDRFPFRYLLDDYGIAYFAAFPGCSAETEAGFGTIIFLSGKMDELGLKTVLITESADRSIARTIINNSEMKNQSILALNSMQSVTANDAANGTTYLSVMENNLNILKEALR